MEMFTPSLDWGNELAASAIWVAKAWSITAVCLVAVLALIARFTSWGRQFWRITGAYFTGRQSLRVWCFLGVLLLSVTIGVRINVLFSYVGNDQFTALQTAFEGNAAGDDAVRQSGIRGFWIAVFAFALFSALYIARMLADTYLTQRFIIAWRIWLTQRLTDEWLDSRAYYRSRFLDSTVDNPDQRIQQDIDVFTTGTGPETNSPVVGTANTLIFGAVTSMMSLVSFAPILWRLSGPLTLFGVTVPKALFWIVLLYVGFATIVAFWIGRPIIGLTFRNERTNAAFRYALVRLRDAGEAVGFYRGEPVERTELKTRFAAIITNYRAFVRRGVAFLGWNRGMTALGDMLPLLVQAPRMFSGQLNFGDVNQSTSAFQNVQDSLSFFRAVYDSFASYRAAIIRLDGLVTANEQARALAMLTTTATADGAVMLDGVSVHGRDGTTLVDPLDVRLLPGDSLVITGPSGCGKTTLLRSLAQMWPYTGGRLHRPGDGTGGSMFVPQVPYLPLGSLRAAVSYPDFATDHPDDAICDALRAVGLGHLGARLDDAPEWAKILSPGEQQRVAFARILLHRPGAVFLDESTSALPEAQELALYELLRSELPDAVIVSVSHRSTVEQHHRRKLELTGTGVWRLEPTPVA